jgi:hypothetical protein
VGSVNESMQRAGIGDLAPHEDLLGTVLELGRVDRNAGREREAAAGRLEQAVAGADAPQRRPETAEMRALGSAWSR